MSVPHVPSQNALHLLGWFLKIFSVREPLAGRWCLRRTRRLKSPANDLSYAVDQLMFLAELGIVFRNHSELSLVNVADADNKPRLAVESGPGIAIHGLFLFFSCIIFGAAHNLSSCPRNLGTTGIIAPGLHTAPGLGVIRAGGGIGRGKFMFLMII